MRKGRLDADLEKIEGAEGDAGVIDRYENSWEAEVKDYFQRINDDALRHSDPLLGPDLNALTRDGAGQIGAYGFQIVFCTVTWRYRSFQSLANF